MVHRDKETDKITLLYCYFRVEGDIADLTLFDPEGKLKPAEYYGHQYCTCVVNDRVYPFGEPKYYCDLTSSMKTCRNTRIPNTVYTASCVNRVLESKRSVGSQISKRSLDITEDDEQPPMYPMVSEPTMDNVRTFTRNHCFLFQCVYLYN